MLGSWVIICRSRWAVRSCELCRSTLLSRSDTGMSCSQEQVKYRKKPGPKSKKQKEAEAAAAAAAAASQADFVDDGEPSQQDFAGGGTELI